MEKMIEFFSTTDMKGTMTECVPREYALANFEVKE